MGAIVLPVTVTENSPLSLTYPLGSIVWRVMCPYCGNSATYTEAIAARGEADSDHWPTRSCVEPPHEPFSTLERDNYGQLVWYLGVRQMPDGSLVDAETLDDN